MKWFTIPELSDSATARARGIPNVPGAEASASLRALAEEVLDPLREAWGAPIYVNSGYRCPRLNEAVGGSRTSQHMLGQAADITAGSRKKNRELYLLAQRLKLPFDQLIWEKGDLSGPQWLHVSHRRGHNRGQALHL